MDGNGLHNSIVGKEGVDWFGGVGLSLRSRSIVIRRRFRPLQTLLIVRSFTCGGRGETLALAVPTLPTFPGVPHHTEASD